MDSIFTLQAHLQGVLLWGFLATAVLTAGLEISQKFGISRIALPFMLGTIFSADRRKANIVGFLVHFLNGWLFAAIYAIIFENFQMASWWYGGILGFFHGALLMILGMSILPYIHPRMADERYGPSATRWLQPPGFMALNYGRRTPLVALAVHVIYGMMIGGAYQLFLVSHSSSG